MKKGKAQIVKGGACGTKGVDHSPLLIPLSLQSQGEGPQKRGGEGKKGEKKKKPQSLNLIALFRAGKKSYRYRGGKKKKGGGGEGPHPTRFPSQIVGEGNLGGGGGGGERASNVL